MQAVILAAGRGKRMQDLTNGMPKPMLKIGGKNLLEWKIDALPKEVDELVMVVGYFGGVIKKYFGRTFNGRKISYIDQGELLGTGSALFKTKDLLGGKFLVMMGDDLYSKKDIRNCLKNGWSVLAKKMAEKGKGAKIIVDKQKNISEIIEGAALKKGDWNNAGMYLLGKEIFNYPLVQIQNGEYGLPQTIALAAKDFEIKIVPATNWTQITSPADLKTRIRRNQKKD